MEMIKYAVKGFFAADGIFRIDYPLLALVYWIVVLFALSLHLTYKFILKETTFTTCKNPILGRIMISALHAYSTIHVRHSSIAHWKARESVMKYPTTPHPA